MTARSRRNERSRKRGRISSLPRWQHPIKLRTPIWHRERTAPNKSANGSRVSRRRGTKAVGSDGLERAALPLVAITSAVARPKSKTKPLLLRGKKLADDAPPVGRGSPFRVIRTGVALPVGQRWAFSVRTTQNQAATARKRPSHRWRRKAARGSRKSLILGATPRKHFDRTVFSQSRQQGQASRGDAESGARSGLSHVARSAAPFESTLQVWILAGGQPMKPVPSFTAASSATPK